MGTGDGSLGCGLCGTKKPVLRNDCLLQLSPPTVLAIGGVAIVAWQPEMDGSQCLTLDRDSFICVQTC